MNNENMKYKKKYLKYKKKYFNLKKLEGGGMTTSDDIHIHIDNFIKSNKTCKVILKKIAPFLKKKIGLNIYFIPYNVWECTYSKKKWVCNEMDYNFYTKYLDDVYPNYKDNKYLLIGLTLTTQDHISPIIEIDDGIMEGILEINLNDKKYIFKAFDKYLPRQFSWSGYNKDKIKIYETKQLLKKIPKRITEFNSKKQSKKNRPSPSESAKLYDEGKKKRGNDGNMYIITVNKNGVKRWMKFKSKKNTKRYKITKKNPKIIKSTLLQQMKDNPWMEEILINKANNIELSDYDIMLFDNMKQQPLPPGGMSKLLKKYKKKK